jgi:hypothetical protein
MSIFQKGRANVATGLSEKRDVSIMLRFAFLLIFLDCILFYVFCGRSWFMGFYVVRTIQPLCNVPCPSHNNGTLLLYLLYHFLKSQEKKWHRSVKMDKNKCPFFKRARGLCVNGPSEKRVVSIML